MLTVSPFLLLNRQNGHGHAARSPNELHLLSPTEGGLSAADASLGLPSASRCANCTAPTAAIATCHALCAPQADLFSSHPTPPPASSVYIRGGPIPGQKMTSTGPRPVQPWRDSLWIP